MKSIKNREELEAYIESFNKPSSEFTLPEILEIGKLMKTIPQSERSWK